MQHILRIVSLLAVVTALTTTGVLGRVAEVSLEQLVEASEVILVGKVVEVREVDGVRVARVRVEQTIKGPAEEEVWYLAQGTWTCDITGGRLNERSILFLNEYEFHPKPDQPIESNVVVIGRFTEPVSFRKNMLETTGGRSLWAVSWADAVK